MKICRGRNSQLVVSCQVVTTPFCCGLAVIWCGFISHLSGRKTINIPEIFYGVHGFTRKTVNPVFLKPMTSIQTGKFPQYPHPQSTVKRKTPTPSVGNRIKHLFRILTSKIRVFYVYSFVNLFIYFSFVPGFSNFVFLVLVFRRSGIPSFRRSMF